MSPKKSSVEKPLKGQSQETEEPENVPIQEDPKGEAGNDPPVDEEASSDTTSATSAADATGDPGLSGDPGDQGEGEVTINEGDRKIAIIVRVTVTEIDDQGNSRKVKEQVIATSRRQKDKVQFELGFKEVDRDSK